MQGTSIENRTSESIKNNYSLLILAGMFVLGMIYGVLLLKSGSETLQSTIDLITKEYTVKLKAQTVLTSFGSCVMSTFVFILIPYFLGYSAVSQPAIMIVPLFKGLGLGFFMANLYTSYGLRGIGFCCLIILPHTLITLFCIVIASREALRLSCMIFKGLTSKHQIAIGFHVVKLYNTKFLVLFLIGLIGCVVDVICVLLFSGLFNF